MDLSDLHGVIHEVVMNDVVTTLPKQAIRVVPDRVESKDLWGVQSGDLTF